MTNEQIMWAVLAAWAVFVIVGIYQLIWGKSLVSQLLPSGTTTVVPGGS